MNKANCYKTRLRLMINNINFLKLIYLFIFYFYISFNFQWVDSIDCLKVRFLEGINETLKFPISRHYLSFPIFYLSLSTAIIYSCSPP